MTLNDDYSFNTFALQTYTQYIPLSVYDLQTWMGSPSIYVYDCSNAGIIVDSFQQFAEQHEKEYEVINQCALKSSDLFARNLGK